MNKEEFNEEMGESLYNHYLENQPGLINQVENLMNAYGYGPAQIRQIASNIIGDSKSITPNNLYLISKHIQNG